MKKISLYMVVFLNFALLMTQDVMAKTSKMLVDKRDGQKYRIVEIGNQTWMAENLNVKTQNSGCYRDLSETCKVYGRLYSWESAKKACPVGWRLPNRKDFEKMISIVGDAAVKKLMSKKGWMDGPRGTDAYGFSALPGGRRNDGSYDYIGNNAFFWISSEYDEDLAYMVWLYQNNEFASIGVGKKDNRYSVRCIKN